MAVALGEGEAETLVELLTSGQPVVPSLWHIEIGNAILMSERRGRLALQAVQPLLSRLAALEVETDGETVQKCWSDTLAAAQRHRLTLYDAAYLELALRRRLPLASLDRELRAAAVKEGVAVLP
ncbi:MAG: twitching motility protein PilT [Rubritepida sp.]|nr:twitching motility protein PilT [Rubritepida sp.]